MDAALSASKAVVPSKSNLRASLKLFSSALIATSGTVAVLPAGVVGATGLAIGLIVPEFNLVNCLSKPSNLELTLPAFLRALFEPFSVSLAALCSYL